MRVGRRYETLLLSAIVAVVVLATLGIALANLGTGALATAGSALFALAIFKAVAAVVMGGRIDRFHHIGALRSGGDNYDQMRNWTRLKVASILLQVLLVVGAIYLASAFLVRIGVFRAPASSGTVLLSTSAIAFVTLLAAQAAHHYSLRTPLQRTVNGLRNVMTLMALSGAVLLALLALLSLARDLQVAGFATLHTGDAPFLLLAAAVLSSIGLFMARELPTIYALFYEERDYYKGKNYLSKSKSVLMPAMVAFSLLFLVVLLLFLFEIGLAGLVGDIHQNLLLLGLFAFIVLALVVSTITAFLLSRSADRAELYKVKRTAEQRLGITILAASSVLTGLLLLVAALLYADVTFLGLKEEWWLDILTFGILFAVGPYGFYLASRTARTRHMEERFPDFLRDIAASHKAGLPMAAAVRIAANGEYGALTPEIRKMADQLSWNVGFTEVLQRFAERVDTPLVRRSVSLMIEAANSGGNITDVLMAAARDAREIKNLESERRGAMSLYTAVIYLTFIVFLGVAVLMYRTFITEILDAASATMAAGGSAGAGIVFSSLTLDDYRIFYFVAALTQGLGNGLIAGLMGTGRLLLGLRHSFIMVGLTYLVFKMVA